MKKLLNIQKKLLNIGAQNTFRKFVLNQKLYVQKKKVSLKLKV